MQPPKLISLSELVKSTADELRAIQSNEPRTPSPVMRFTECEVELAVAVGADAEGKVKFWVVEAGTGLSYENTQKVKLKFSAIPGAPPIQAPAVRPGPAQLP